MNIVRKIRHFVFVPSLYIWILIVQRMVSDSVHINIRRMREAAGLSQAAMADELGIGRTTYINFETGRTKVYSSVFSRFAKHFGASESEIIGASEERSDLLRQDSDFEAKRRELIKDYEGRLAGYREKCAILEARLAKSEELISSLTKTNDYLISQLHKND